MATRTRFILPLILALYAATLAAPAVADRRDRPGKFDYYVLSLSWSPQHCAEPPGSHDTQQCGAGRRFAFVLHGLWPQYERGFPESCEGKRRVPDPVTDEMLDIMPSTRLIRHEWEKHGTCSGLDVRTYFATARRAFEDVRIPPGFKEPRDARRLTFKQIEREFAAANPGLEADEIAVLCDGRFLQEVRICLDRDLRVRRCGRDVRDRCRGEVIVPPVR